jgi:polyhydroxybutyrate depolymerase
MRPSVALLAVGLAVSGCSSSAALSNGPGPGTDGGNLPQVDGNLPHPDSGNLPQPGDGPCTGLGAQPLDSQWTVSFGGLDRMIDAHVPANYDPTRRTALILNFHGYTSNSGQEALLSKMNDKSDLEGFVVLYPNGTGSSPSWNAGACCGEAAMNMVDDVGFVSAVIDAAEARLCVDRRRVFATGMSNGGFLSHRLACELSNRIAAAAPVAGVLGIPTCTPTRPVPIMGFHGTADPLVPYNGSTSLNFPPVPDTYANWAIRDGCTQTPAETFRMMDSHCSTYSGCKGGSEVTLCTVDGGGHTWPGGTPIPVGYTTTYLSATDAMWTFFQKHAMP